MGGSASLAALRPDPWNISLLCNQEGQVGAEPLGAPCMPCLPTVHRELYVAWHVTIHPIAWESRTTHTQFAAKAAAPKTQRCAVANAKRARDWDCFVPRAQKWLWFGAHKSGFADTVIPSLRCVHRATSLLQHSTPSFPPCDTAVK